MNIRMAEIRGVRTFFPSTPLAPHLLTPWEAHSEWGGHDLDWVCSAAFRRVNQLYLQRLMLYSDCVSIMKHKRFFPPDSPSPTSSATQVKPLAWHRRDDTKNLKSCSIWRVSSLGLELLHAVVCWSGNFSDFSTESMLHLSCSMFPPSEIHIFLTHIYRKIRIKCQVITHSTSWRSLKTNCWMPWTLMQHI